MTGATSMIGTALIEAAVARGDEVYAIVRPNTKRLNRVIVSSQVHIVEGTLDTFNNLEVDSDCDVFYHLAWMGTDKVSRDNPEIQEQNIKYTLDAVKLAKKAGCHRFVGAGSQAEYGPIYDEINEETKFSPAISYGVAKYAACVMSRKLCECIGMEHVWGRIFSVYGPHDNKGTMLEYAIRCWDNGEIAKFSSGTQQWNYLYESDAGEMLYRLGCEHVVPSSYFIAHPESHMLKEFILTLMKEYGSKAKAEFANAESTQLPGLKVDMKKTLSALQYEPRMSFETGIKKMIDAMSTSR